MSERIREIQPQGSTVVTFDAKVLSCIGSRAEVHCFMMSLQAKYISELCAKMQIEQASAHHFARMADRDGYVGGSCRQDGRLCRRDTPGAQSDAGDLPQV